MKFLVFILLSGFLLVSSNLFSGDKEDYEWWAKAHNWDYITPWRAYLKTSAAFFGPSALPVPSLNKALINNKFHLEFRPELHYSKGDLTTDIFTSLKIPLATRVDFEIFVVPLEYFTLDSATRHNRAVRHIDAQGVEGGDFWFGTNFLLLKESNYKLDLVASVYFKTASGTGLEYARFTDAPGYFMLLSGGKNVWKSSADSSALRFYGQAGFYAYQTWDYLHNQNDCVVYGLGVEYSKPFFKVNAELTGYYGYLGNGDRPLVFRTNWSTNYNVFNLSFNYQIGLHDFNYHSVGLGLIYSFAKTLNP